MNKIDKAIAIDFSDEGSLASIEFLRAAVRWLDYRIETLNADKTVASLLNEYAQAVIDYDG